MHGEGYNKINTIQAAKIVGGLLEFEDLTQCASLDGSLMCLSGRSGYQLFYQMEPNTSALGATFKDFVARPKYYVKHLVSINEDFSLAVTKATDGNQSEVALYNVRLRDLVQGSQLRLSFEVLSVQRSPNDAMEFALVTKQGARIY